MASTAPPFTPLAPEQRRLLLAALSSYKKNPTGNSPSDSNNSGATPSAQANMASVQGVSPSVFSNSESHANGTADPALSLDFDAFDHNNFNFDLDDAAAQDGLQDTFTGFPLDGDGQGEKRKSPEEDEDGDEEGDAKRHEGDEKGSKKPGRKPLTSEPTTVRSLLARGSHCRC